VPAPFRADDHRAEWKIGPARFVERHAHEMLVIGGELRGRSGGEKR
jgi:hypothetical protein